MINYYHVHDDKQNGRTDARHPMAFWSANMSLRELMLQDLAGALAIVRDGREVVPAWRIQSRLRDELNATKNRMRANQSIAEYGISKLREQAWAATRKTASVEMKLETKSSSFTMRDIDPAAAEALRDFAAQIISARERAGFIFPAGTA
jgi:hypothetical protein